MLAVRIPSAGRLLAWVLAASSFTLVAAPAHSQAALGDARRQTTRAELERIAEAAQTAARSTNSSELRARYLADLNIIQQRLRNGDFLPGDRILLTVLGDSALSDTFTVRLNRVLRLPGLPEFSLEGILDSELTQYLTTEISKYIKSPQVTATGLLRLSVLGAVNKPGFLTVPIDQALTDVVMTAGGPGTNADLDRAIVRRGTQTLIDKNELKNALRFGKTVGDVAMRDGDEFYIPEKSNTNKWTQTIGILSAVGGLFWAIRFASGR
jgi:protein involved in polysaccharide export with SLBB domain